jgi:hypothetical protein
MIKFIDLYNEITGQAWSMFDGDVEAQDEFETSVTTSIQKALNALWCSYDFPFRERTHLITTRANTNKYVAPIGNIIKKTSQGKKVFAVKFDYNKYLEYDPDIELLEPKTGKPEKFYIKNDEVYLYPIPDNRYLVTIDYLSLYPACDSEGSEKATLVDDEDYINIPERYEQLFKSALLPKAMYYAIASETDENYNGYKEQYEEAYKLLIKYSRGIDIDKTIGW